MNISSGNVYTYGTGVKFTAGGRIISLGGEFVGTRANLGLDETAFLTVGKSLAMNNTANFRYVHSSDSSGNNRVGIGFWGNDDILVVKPSGNVGIGITSPNYNLDVAGNINFTGNLYKNGNIFGGSGRTVTTGIVAWNNIGNPVSNVSNYLSIGSRTTSLLVYYVDPYETGCVMLTCVRTSDGGDYRYKMVSYYCTPEGSAYVGLPDVQSDPGILGAFADNSFLTFGPRKGGISIEGFKEYTFNYTIISYK